MRESRVVERRNNTLDFAGQHCSLRRVDLHVVLTFEPNLPISVERQRICGARTEAHRTFEMQALKAHN
jgi:hypothetical protein